MSIGVSKMYYRKEDIRRIIKEMQEMYDGKPQLGPGFKLAINTLIRNLLQLEREKKLEVVK